MKYRSMLLASAALHAGIVNGMGLGGIDVQSYLGAPLEAQIHLLSAQDLGASDIRVNLARHEVYDRFQARYEASHSDLKFDLVTDANGEKAIRVRTSKRIVEPFLDIVVELSWPTGTTYRRYNLLLDPPNYAAAHHYSPQPALNPELTRAIVKGAPVPAAPVSAPKALAPKALAKVELDGSYVVRSGDSLWKVARAFRSTTGLSIQQTMDVLFAANPQAFVRGDKNRLKLGATLSVPATEVRSAQAEQPAPVSLNQVDNQSYTRAATDIAFADTVASTVAVTPVVVDPVNEPLTEMERLQAQLAELQADRAQLVAFQASVRSELAQLQGKQQAMRQTIAIAEAISEQIENEGAQVTEAGMVQPELAAHEMEPVAPTQSVMEDSAGETPMMVPESRPAVAQDLIAGNATGNEVIEKSGSGFWYLLALIPLGILILMMGLRSRKVQEVKRTDIMQDEDLYELVFGAKRDRSKADSPEQVRQAMDHIKEKATHQEVVLEQVKREEEEASKDDVNQMIELYMLYSQYQKALNVILTEIAKRPARKDLRIYLMQVYAQTGDWQAFDDQMQVLRRMGDVDLLNAAEQLRQQDAYEAVHRNAS